MGLWQYHVAVLIVAIIICWPACATESERHPGIEGSVEYSPASAIDLNYFQWEVLGVSGGVYTSKLLHSAEDFETEANAAIKKDTDEGRHVNAGIALAANSMAIRKYSEGDYTSGEKNQALSRCYQRSASLYAASYSDQNKEFAEDMYDRALQYNRFNFDAWDGKIKVLESQGSFVAAQEARNQKQQAMNDQGHIAWDAMMLPLPGYIVIIALLAALVMMWIRRPE